MWQTRWHLLGILIALGGCFQSNSTGPVGGETQACVGHCGRSSAIRPGGGGSSGSASTSSSGSSASSGSGSGGASGSASTSSGSSGSSTGSTSSGFSGSVRESEYLCPAIEASPATADCQAGSSFASQLVDVLECAAVANASVAIIGSDGVPVAGAAATTASNGNFAVCLPSGSSFSIQITAALYPTTYYAEMLNTDAGYIPQVAAMSSEFIATFSALVPGGFQPGTALVIAKLVGTSCHSQFAGWSIGVELPDGGAPADGGYQFVYLAASGVPDPTATATASNGVALFYNIDPSISDFLVVTATNPDAGDCPVLNEAEGFTGRVYVASGGATVDTILLP